MRTPGSFISVYSEFVCRDVVDKVLWPSIKTPLKLWLGRREEQDNFFYKAREKKGRGKKGKWPERSRGKGRRMRRRKNICRRFMDCR